jgi:hypothetical protein
VERAVVDHNLVGLEEILFGRKIHGWFHIYSRQATEDAPTAAPFRGHPRRHTHQPRGSKARRDQGSSASVT